MARWVGAALWGLSAPGWAAAARGQKPAKAWVVDRWCATRINAPAAPPPAERPPEAAGGPQHLPGVAGQHPAGAGAAGASRAARSAARADVATAWPARSWCTAALRHLGWLARCCGVQGGTALTCCVPFRLQKRCSLLVSEQAKQDKELVATRRQAEALSNERDASEQPPAAQAACSPWRPPALRSTRSRLPGNQPRSLPRGAGAARQLHHRARGCCCPHAPPRPAPPPPHSIPTRARSALRAGSHQGAECHAASDGAPAEGGGGGEEQAACAGAGHSGQGAGEIEAGVPREAGGAFADAGAGLAGQPCIWAGFSRGAGVGWG